MSVSYYTADRLTAISQDPNRCECDPSKGPDSPIKHSREARLSTLTFEGTEVSGGNQSKPQIDFDSRIQFPDSRCSSQEGSTFDSCLIFFFFSCCNKENITPSTEEFSNSLPSWGQKMSQILSFFSFFSRSPPLSRQK